MRAIKGEELHPKVEESASSWLEKSEPSINKLHSDQYNIREEMKGKREREVS